MEHFFTVLRIPEDWDRIQLAVSYFTGPALDWWRSLEDSVDLRPTTWENFKIELENTFQTINPVETARNKLALLEQVTTVRQYATQFRSTALLIPGITDEEKMDRFIRGLKLEVQKETRFKTPKSFDEAVQIAERYEGVTYQVQLPRTNNNRFNRANRYANGGASTSSTSTNYSSAVPFRNGGSNGPTRMELGAATAVNRQRRPKLTEELRMRLIRQGRCFFCREPGHIAKDCPERKRLMEGS
ncbi:hypothetical protein C2E21_3113 [Chlorella sorokiniana]|uniref:CCHC-type domain-containing protein n=1 Tax=Chlorella sorokiniana TaxID=3076 RepID=A0A2P6TW38_CHLSO|nr:hypothetical protein C2E21_3113 [Chlorella sorokiniana]|eukprot:PRW58283.1 hypothetical protein C2E21_3113 [Chlorella sorokiniana]